MKLFCSILLWLPILAPAFASEPRAVDTDWPRWRGPRGDGTWYGPKLPERWPDGGLRRLWSRPVGGGYSAVVVAGGRVYVTDRRKQPDEVERVLAFDAVTGRPLWSHSYAVRYGDLDYGNGPRSCPLVFDGRLYTLGAVGRLQCLDAVSGKPMWSTHLVDGLGGEVPKWGFAASPVVFEDLLILPLGAKPKGGMVALDRRTGAEVWRSVYDPAGYATPLLVSAPSGTQLVCWSPLNLRGLDPRTGNLHWTVPFKVTYGTSIATPIYYDRHVFIANYWEGSKSIRLGSEPGDAKVVWEDTRTLRGLMSTPLWRDGRCYLLDKRYGLTCFEWRSGEKLWDDDNRMTPKGRNPQATMVWLGNTSRVIVLNSAGELILARMSPAGYQEQCRAQILGTTWAHPAYVGSRVYARSDSELVCVSWVEPTES